MIQYHYIQDITINTRNGNYFKVFLLTVTPSGFQCYIDSHNISLFPLSLPPINPHGLLSSNGNTAQDAYENFMTLLRRLLTKVDSSDAINYVHNPYGVIHISLRAQKKIVNNIFGTGAVTVT